ncbi:MAG: endonuclease domain-containing protein [Nitrososphaera sp.]
MKRYGLSRKEWVRLARAQSNVCGVCDRLPASERLVVDHEHRVGWAKLPAAERKMYVRGLCCQYCNHYVVGRLTLDKAKRVVKFLEAYERRKGER